MMLNVHARNLLAVFRTFCYTFLKFLFHLLNKK